MAKFQCLNCARCCRGLTVPVTRLDLAKWLRLGLYWLAASVVEVRGLEAFRMGSTLIYAMPRRVDGSCLYLDGFNCSIYPVRPLVCVLFPFAYSSRKDEVGPHPWAPLNCEAFRKGLVEVSEEEGAKLLEIARALFKELRGVDGNKEDYEKLVGEARARLRASVSYASQLYQPPVLPRLANPPRALYLS
ncbi:MAG: YkgJ family cysteine cluster protein [Candidatus Nezhaarchaeota archaeon]|nr:YkgJ family cysteine cluster protein [Candidatus Nezhaarchaeota archaeon]